MKLKLPPSVSSPQDLTSLILEIHDYARWFAHEAIKKRVSGSASSHAPLVSAGTEELLRSWALQNPLSTNSLTILITTLEEYKKTAPSLTVTLAAPPTNGIKMALVEWCRTNISPNILVSFSFNGTLLGGMVIRYGSRVFDWSFRRQILDGRSKFPEVLRRV